MLPALPLRNAGTPTGCGFGRTTVEGVYGLASEPHPTADAAGSFIGVRVGEPLVARMHRSQEADMVGIAEIVEVIARAVEVFGDRAKALRWLRTPLPTLGDATPEEMLEREGGIEQVEQALGRIEHGVW